MSAYVNIMSFFMVSHIEVSKMRYVPCSIICVFKLGSVLGARVIQACSYSASVLDRRPQAQTSFLTFSQGSLYTQERLKANFCVVRRGIHILSLSGQCSWPSYRFVLFSAYMWLLHFQMYSLDIVSMPQPGRNARTSQCCFYKPFSCKSRKAKHLHLLVETPASRGKLVSSKDLSFVCWHRIEDVEQCVLLKLAEIARLQSRRGLLIASWHLCPASLSAN